MVTNLSLLMVFHELMIVSEVILARMFSSHQPNLTGITQFIFYSLSHLFSRTYL